MSDAPGMPTTRDWNALEALVGYTFRSPELLREALTHATYANENPLAGPNYERLEFLGDAVVDLLAARLLFEQFPAASEGELSRRRARVVRRETLATLAERLQLSVWVRLGEGQRRSGGGTSLRILADTFEAVVGAVFLDGGYAAVESAFAGLLRAAIAETHAPVDFKTRLQEACHRLGFQPPEYRVVAIEGPDHARRFVCEVWVDATVRGRGEGSSKKIAEQVCAHQAMQAIDTRVGT